IEEPMMMNEGRLNVIVNAPSLRHEIECIENETLAASIIEQMERAELVNIDNDDHHHDLIKG
nr:hypothetical protein [Tanacetum cinerariifolium]